MRPNRNDITNENLVNEIKILPLSLLEKEKGQPSQTVNLILMMQDHGTHAIAELDGEIYDLDEKRQLLIEKRDTIKKMLDIANAHKTSVKR